jgi:hypothetical protein
VWNSASSLTVNIDVTNTTSSAVSLADKLHVAMVEDEVTYSSAPGSNGETQFEYVLRQFYDASTGISSTTGTSIGSIAAGATESFSFTISAIPSGVRDVNEVSFACFLQNDAAKTVYQADKSDASVVAGALNISTANASVAASDYCDLSFTPAVLFTNNDATTITTVTLEYTLNNTTAVSQTFNGNLTTGQSTTIAFPVVNLIGGINTVNYVFTDINSGGGAANPSATTIPTGIYAKLNTAAVAAPVNEGMENGTLTESYSTRDVSTAIFDDPDGTSISNFMILDGSVISLGPTGGFAASNRSLFFDFYALQNSEVMNFVMHKINLSNNSELTFSHAYRQYTTENDRLEVLISSDCGANWTSVFNNAGAALATGAAQSAAFYATAANEWVANVIDISSFDNTNDVIVKFKATSAYGNNLFVDDINITQGAVSVTEVNQNVANLRIHPNPVRNRMNVAFNSESEVANILIRNLQGQVVQSISENTVKGANVIEINTTAISAGVYFLTIASETTISTQRFVVNK